MGAALNAELAGLGLTLDNLEEAIAKTRLMGVIYGPTGGGKSTMFDSLPEKKGVYANIEKGERSVVGSKAGWKIDIETVVQYTKVLKGLYTDIQNGDNEFDYLFTDSATELYKREIARQAKASAADPSNKQDDPDIPSQRDYLKVSKIVDRVLIFAKDKLPMTVIFTAIDQIITDDQKIERIAPAMSPSIRDSFLMYSDFVLYLTKNSNGDRILYTQSSGKIIAKCRMPIGKSIPPRILNPNLYDVLRAINGENVHFDVPQ